MDKTLDYQGRWRSKTVAFRVSEEEGKLLDDCVRILGLTKQDYIIRKLLNREVVVQGNPRVYKALRNQMAEIYEQLQGSGQYSEISEELLYTIQVVAETLNGLKGESPLLAESSSHFPLKNKEDL
ncbi:hypothetical protein HMPREF1093_03082 [Hungatella hathewayi 12489931]|uniref:plasmid mobilization protein n=1 Tax=Hungatella hathewayi TaxID=154046 RepID=UPI0002D1B678|nr:hypothetical protein [Hungatella hathewayi]ENY94066.1 hypothetical protein HMPREF1093_03082 [Hungatella hathewayi 12489931]